MNSNGWETVDLSAIVDIKTGKLDSNAAIENGKYLFFTCSPETYRINNYTFDTEAILLAGNNANGIFPIKHYTGKFNAYQRTYVITAKKSSTLYLKYLYYQLTTQLSMLQEFSIGSATKFLTMRILGPLKIPLPSFSEQRAIAGILGALDDKIELNRRMNATLEAMARAVFRQWFVDGEEVGQVKDLGEVITGKTPPTNDRENYGGEIPFITIPDMHGKMFVIETGKTLSLHGVQTQRNKTLPPFSICISCIATPGLVSMTTKYSQTNQQINSLIPKDKKSTYYCYFALRELGYEIRARGSGGSVLLNLNKGQFETMPIPIPSADLMHKFNKFAEPFLLQIVANEKESHTLASLRDSMLPKLMSGEVRVKDVEG